ncbi:MAG: hypothetical protein CVU57_18505 [Deltaproteobacteria bacterium HGW-Deltaproteobacteria-15]|nr:MAG: hypothetical protein CVU57_18505 [Deltaproteobacteria bacterium HGW-Deltaproteobacteria-15]
MFGLVLTKPSTSDPKRFSRSGVRRSISVFSVQCSVFSVQCSVFRVQCSAFSVQPPADNAARLIDIQR